MNNIVDLIDKCTLKKEVLIGVENRLDYSILSSDLDPVLTSIYQSFINFYEDAVAKGFNKNTASKIIIKIMEDGIKNSLKNDLKDLQPLAVATVQKKNDDFKSYLKYASDKWGTDEEKIVVENLINKIK